MQCRGLQGHRCLKINMMDTEFSPAHVNLCFENGVRLLLFEHRGLVLAEYNDVVAVQVIELFQTVVALEIEPLLFVKSSGWRNRFSERSIYHQNLLIVTHQRGREMHLVQTDIFAVLDL